MPGRTSAGCADARHGLAVLCMALSGGLLMAAGLATSGCTHIGSGQLLSAGYAAVLVTQDRDRDGGLDRGEVTAMVERGFPPDKRAAPGWATLRAWLVAAYMEQDADGDGRLVLAELLQPGRAACVDLDGDGQLSPAEVAASVGRCPAGTLPPPEGPDGG